MGWKVREVKSKSLARNPKFCANAVASSLSLIE